MASWTSRAIGYRSAVALMSCPEQEVPIPMGGCGTPARCGTPAAGPLFCGKGIHLPKGPGVLNWHMEAHARAPLHLGVLCTYKSRPAVAMQVGSGTVIGGIKGIAPIL